MTKTGGIELKMYNKGQFSIHRNCPLIIMKIIFYLLFMLASAVSSKVIADIMPTGDGLKTVMELEMPQAILKVDTGPISGSCGKYCWQEAKVIEVIKKIIDEPIASAIKIASYSWTKPAPKGVSIVNLRKYGDVENAWILINIEKDK